MNAYEALHTLSVRNNAGVSYFILTGLKKTVDLFLAINFTM